MLALLMMWGYKIMRKAYMDTFEQEKAIDTLARTAWGEARGDGRKGIQAVINVVMNRVKHGGWWGANVIDVCKKPAQFSAWNENDPNYQKMMNVTRADEWFDLAYVLARTAITDELPDITGGATHYHAKSINPKWAVSLNKTATIGNHIFYV